MALASGSEDLVRAEPRAGMREIYRARDAKLNRDCGVPRKGSTADGSCERGGMLTGLTGESGLRKLSVTDGPFSRDHGAVREVQP